MAKVIVTKELAEVLKNLRIQNSIKANELASYLEKSPAYITKLEKGDIQTLKEDEFKKILNFILKNNSDINMILENVYNILKFKYSDEEIQQQLWFMNFDLAVRKIPVPASLVDEINDIITKNNILPNDLLVLINQNYFIYKEDRDNNNIPYNTWFNDKDNNSCIKISLSEDLFNSFLQKKEKKIEYIYPYSILYYIFVLKSNKAIESISDQEKMEFFDEATKILNKHKFYSIVERNRIISDKKTESEIEEILSTFDINNKKIINGIISQFKFLADYDISITNTRLNKFFENLEFDAGLMLKIISLNYSKLNGISVDKKKSFISEVEDLIEKYSNEKNNVEMY